MKRYKRELPKFLEIEDLERLEKSKVYCYNSFERQIYRWFNYNIGCI